MFKQKLPFEEIAILSDEWTKFQRQIPSCFQTWSLSVRVSNYWEKDNSNLPKIATEFRAFFWEHSMSSQLFFPQQHLFTLPRATWASELKCSSVIYDVPSSRACMSFIAQVSLLGGWVHQQWIKRNAWLIYLLTWRSTWRTCETLLNFLKGSYAVQKNGNVDFAFWLLWLSTLKANCDIVCISQCTVTRAT